MEQLCSTLRNRETMWVLYILFAFSVHEGARVCVNVCLSAKRECAGVLLWRFAAEKRSMLGFIIRIQGSPLALVISQTCPRAPKQGKWEGGWK